MSFEEARTIEPPGDSARYQCPCCRREYQTFIIGKYDWDHPRKCADGSEEVPLVVERAASSDGTTLDVCSRCHLPCCPRCENIAGEGIIVCTRCTTYPACAHAGGGKPAENGGVRI